MATVIILLSPDRGFITTANEIFIKYIYLFALGFMALNLFPAKPFW